MHYSQLPAELTDGLTITGVTPLSGGDISQAFRVDTPDASYFLKAHQKPKKQMFEREARGLKALRDTAPETLGVPEVVRASSRGLMLEWIEEGGRTFTSEADLGNSLAELHQVPQPHFGGIDGDDSGFLGSVEVDLTPTQSWPDFYVYRRVQPLITQATAMGAVPSGVQRLFDELLPKAVDLCGPDEPPALVHGDLWGGNRLVDVEGRNWLIDPAAYYAHREVDLAMMLLFGGFGKDAFIAYNNTYPLADGWHERVSWYQLPPLLVHAILFGGGYGASVVRVLTDLAG